MAERFTLLTELGRGGMGVVWKARDAETGSIVALKLLREMYAEDAEYLTRFERELELARRIDSANVVKVLGFGVRKKVPYLALEYVDGPSLHDAIVSHGPYSWPEAEGILAQVAQGLADAHAVGVVHRDVKPSNVLIGPDGVAKLTDFGIARGLDLTRFTATSTILGTPAYLAPEGPKDARSDLYSLGIIGYELLTGFVPFQGTSYQEVIIDHIRTAPDLEKLPFEARSTIGWLLEKNPADRPQRATDLLPMLRGETAVPTDVVGRPAYHAAPRPEPEPVPTQQPSPVRYTRAESPSVPATTGRRGSPRRGSLIVGIGAVALVVCLVAAVLGAGFISVNHGATGLSSSSTTAPALATGTPIDSVATASAGPSPSVSRGPLTVSSFDNTFAAMTQVTSVESAGSGSVDVILPDVTTSTRYTMFDAPYLTQAFTTAGYPSTNFKIDNASGTANTEVEIAKADIKAGAKVLIVDPLDGPTGNQIQTQAQAAGVAMISYDRATFQGTKTYFVSFDPVLVGKAIGKGFEQCVTDWGVTSPKLYVLDGGEDTDPYAVDAAKGYNSVLWGTAVPSVKAGKTNGLGYKLVKEGMANGWDNGKGQSAFQQAYNANKSINATVEANDGLANAVITILKNASVQPKKIPTTGQDATTPGMANILQGYQCGSVYKPIYLEAEAAVALATYLRAGKTPPAGLVNGTTKDPTSTKTEPSVLLGGIWVNAANMESTVIKDGFINASDLCAAVGADVCSAAGIS